MYKEITLKDFTEDKTKIKILQKGYIISQIHYQIAPLGNSMKHSALVEYEDKESK